MRSLFFNEVIKMENEFKKTESFKLVIKSLKTCSKIWDSGDLLEAAALIKRTCGFIDNVRIYEKRRQDRYLDAFARYLGMEREIENEIRRIRDLDNKYFDFAESDLDEIEENIKYRFFEDQCPNTKYIEYVIKYEYIYKGKKHIAYVNENFEYIYPLCYGIGKDKYEKEKELFWSLFSESTVEKQVFIIRNRMDETRFEFQAQGIDHNPRYYLF